jgi:hypothetical protein
VLGTAAATIAGLAWARSGLSTTFGHVPPADLLAILVGLPLVAAVGGWLLAGREPPAIRQAAAGVNSPKQGRWPGASRPPFARQPLE